MYVILIYSRSSFVFDAFPLSNFTSNDFYNTHFLARGIFNFAQGGIFKKSMKASFKLTKLIATGEPSINTSLQ